MRLLSALIATLCLLALPACDLLELPPDVTPPDGASHPYGEGNGRLAFVSDLADAVRIDVTVAGESIGSITRSSGCPSTMRGDDGLATAILPAGRYQYTATAASGVAWGPTTITVEEDEETRQVLVGRPSDYALHLPDEFEGYPASTVGGDIFLNTVWDPATPQIRVFRPAVAQGDRIDVVVNGIVVGRDLTLGVSDLWLELPLSPGPNWIAVRLSHDEGNDGAAVRTSVYDGDTYLFNVYSESTRVTAARWVGSNLRNAC